MKWLKLDLEGIDFHFRVSGYKLSSKDSWDDDWCYVDLTAQSRGWLDYQIISDPILLSVEVDELIATMDNLLHDRLEHDAEMECIEPDLRFRFSPKKYLRDDPSTIYLSDNNAMADIDMDLAIFFWDKEGALSANRLVLAFGREDIERFSIYLKYVSGALGEQDIEVKELVEQGVIYGQ